MFCDLDFDGVFSGADLDIRKLVTARSYLSSVLGRNHLTGEPLAVFPLTRRAINPDTRMILFTRNA